MRSRQALFFSLTVTLLFLSRGTARADCQTGCWESFNECNSSCSQCNCSGDYNLCLDSCQYVDTDGDGVYDSTDNCADVANSNQTDCDADGFGNACDPQNGTFVASGNRMACASDKKNYPGYTRYRVTYQQRNVDTSACHAPDRWNHSTVTQKCYGFCSSLDDNACGGACWNTTGYQCVFGDVCGSNLGTWFCNPDTI